MTAKRLGGMKKRKLKIELEAAQEKTLMLFNEMHLDLRPRDLMEFLSWVEGEAHTRFHSLVGQKLANRKIELPDGPPEGPKPGA